MLLAYSEGHILLGVLLRHTLDSVQDAAGKRSLLYLMGLCGSFLLLSYRIGACVRLNSCMNMTKCLELLLRGMPMRMAMIEQTLILSDCQVDHIMTNPGFGLRYTCDARVMVSSTTDKPAYTGSTYKPCRIASRSMALECTT